MMTKQAVRHYFQTCRELGVPPSVALGTMLKHNGMEKSGSLLMEKSAYSWIKTVLPYVAAAGLGGGAGYGVGAYGKGKLKDENQLLRENQAYLKDMTEKIVQQGQAPNRNQIIGGLGGGTIGLAIGPELFPSLDKPNARILGGVAGATLGSLIGTYFGQGQQPGQQQQGQQQGEGGEK